MRSILIVDDELSIRSFLHDVLEDEGYHVVSAADGRVALQVLAVERVDLVITDFAMPRLNGLELAKAMREHETLQSVPVILMSAMPRPDLDGLSGVVFLLKPFSLDPLLDMVAETISPTDG